MLHEPGVGATRLRPLRHRRQRLPRHGRARPSRTGGNHFPPASSRPARLLCPPPPSPPPADPPPLRPAAYCRAAFPRAALPPPCPFHSLTPVPAQDMCVCNHMCVSRTAASQARPQKSSNTQVVPHEGRSSVHPNRMPAQDTYLPALGEDGGALLPKGTTTTRHAGPNHLGF